MDLPDSDVVRTFVHTYKKRLLMHSYNGQKRRMRRGKEPGEEKNHSGLLAVVGRRVKLDYMPVRDRGGDPVEYSGIIGGVAKHSIAISNVVDTLFS